MLLHVCACVRVYVCVFARLGAYVRASVCLRVVQRPDGGVTRHAGPGGQAATEQNEAGNGHNTCATQVTHPIEGKGG